MAASGGGSMGSYTLPVDRVADLIRNKVFESRITLIIGQTGTGKSSRVPQMLQEELNGIVLCTQPRRLAAVAIAKRVAQERGCTLGEEVGFRIGQKSVASPNTKILFTTAGLLLEELRNQGAAALRRVKCVICDEVHERSAESDLLLASIHALMRGRQLQNLKLVLMSATADVDRYRRHFSEGRQEPLVVVDIPDISGSLRTIMAQWLHSIREDYLEAVVRRLEAAGHPSAAAHRGLLSAVGPEHGAPIQQIGMPMQLLVRDLVLQLDLEEAQAGNAAGVIMVFLPTYKALELQYSLLRASGAPLDIYPLHSSIDVDECIRSMEAEGSLEHRKVILATNVAESSVTIKGVCHVIDTCVSNQVSWDPQRRTEQASVVWASQSQCKQRAGRCGRTCSGTVHRLLPRRAYLQLPKFEAPAIKLSSLRREALLLISSEAKEMCQAQGLLASMMDPPEPAVVADALEHLVNIHAAQRRAGRSNTYEATLHGRFLAALPVSLDAALLVARGGLAELLWEASALAAICNTTPYPIQQPFGADAAMVFARQYAGLDAGAGAGSAAANGSQAPLSLQHQQQGHGKGSKSGAAAAGAGGGPLTRDVLLLANLAAYEFWQKSCRDEQRLTRLADGGGAAALAAASETERTWCEAHRLNLSSLLNVADTQKIILGIVHKFRPCFLHKQQLPEYYSSSFVHTCSIISGLRHCSLAGVTIAAMHHPAAAAQLRQILTGGAWQAPDDQASEASSSADRANSSAGASSSAALSSAVDEADVCRYFLRGNCTRGVSCPFLHVRPLCRFYLSPSGCRNGNACFYLHEHPCSRNSSTSSAAPPLLDAAAPLAGPAAPPPLQFEWGNGSASSSPPALDLQQLATQVLCSNSSGLGTGVSRRHAGPEQVLLLGEGDFGFCEALLRLLPVSMQLVGTGLDGQDTVKAVYGDAMMTKRLQQLRAKGVDVRHGVDATALPLGLEGMDWGRVRHIVFMFPLMPGTGERGASDDQCNGRLMARWFAAVARLVLTFALNLRVHVALCLDQYARWNLEAVSRDACFFLAQSRQLKPSHGYSPVRGDMPEPFPLDRAVLYSFQFVPPKQGLGFQLQARIWRLTEAAVAEVDATRETPVLRTSSGTGHSSHASGMFSAPSFQFAGAAVLVHQDGPSPTVAAKLPPPPIALKSAPATTAAMPQTHLKRRGRRRPLEAVGCHM